MGNPRMLVVFTLASAIVVGAVVSLATDNWWFLLLAVAAHVIATVLVLGYTFKAIESGDKPDPVEEARLEAEGRDGGGTGGLTQSGRRDDREVVH